MCTETSQTSQERQKEVNHGTVVFLILWIVEVAQGTQSTFRLRGLSDLPLTVQSRSHGSSKWLADVHGAFIPH